MMTLPRVYRRWIDRANMPEAPPKPVTQQELDERVDALVEQVARAAAPSGPTASDLAEDSTATIDEQTASMIAQAEQAVPNPEAEANPSKPAVAEVAEDLELAMEQAAAAAASLDAQIAAEAEAFDDFSDAATVLSNKPSPTPVPVAAPGMASASPGSSAPASTPALAAVPAPSAVPSAGVEPAAPAKPAPDAAPTPAVKPPIPAAPAPAAAGATVAAAATRPSGGAAASQPQSAGKPRSLIGVPLSILEKLVFPFAFRLGMIPIGMRQTLGWAALVTLFNAGVIWVYVLAIMPTTPPGGGVSEVRIVGGPGEGEALAMARENSKKAAEKPASTDGHGSKEAAAPAKKDEHAAKSDEHGAAKKDEHGAAKKDEHGAAKKDEHASANKNEHGAKPEKKASKGKKEEGHGGH